MFKLIPTRRFYTVNVTKRVPSWKKTNSDTSLTLAPEPLNGGSMGQYGSSERSGIAFGVFSRFPPKGSTSNNAQRILGPPAPVMRCGHPPQDATFTNLHGGVLRIRRERRREGGCSCTPLYRPVEVAGGWCELTGRIRGIRHVLHSMISVHKPSDCAQSARQKCMG